MQKLREILKLRIPKYAFENDDQFKKAIELAKLQLGATERVLATQARVDETKLRAKAIDPLPRLLIILAEERIGLAKVLDGQALGYADVTDQKQIPAALPGEDQFHEPR